MGSCLALIDLDLLISYDCAPVKPVAVVLFLFYSL